MAKSSSMTDRALTKEERDRLRAELKNWGCLDYRAILSLLDALDAAEREAYPRDVFDPTKRECSPDSVEGSHR